MKNTGSSQTYHLTSGLLDRNVANSPQLLHPTDRKTLTLSLAVYGSISTGFARNGKWAESISSIFRFETKDLKFFENLTVTSYSFAVHSS